MEIVILGIVIFLQFGFIIYQDRANRAEREAHLLKFMSKDAQEYKSVTEKPAETVVSEIDLLVDVEEASPDELLAAKDNS